MCSIFSKTFLQFCVSLEKSVYLHMCWFAEYDQTFFYICCRCPILRNMNKSISRISKPSQIQFRYAMSPYFGNRLQRVKNFWKPYSANDRSQEPTCLRMKCDLQTQPKKRCYLEIFWSNWKTLKARSAFEEMDSNNFEKFVRWKSSKHILNFLTSKLTTYKYK